MTHRLPWRRAGAAVAAISLLATGVGAASATTPGAVASPESGETVAATPTSTHTFTLVTGDRAEARTDADGAIVSAGLRDAEGADVFATTVQEGRDVYVFPQGVQTLVDGGLVDRELFNLTTLLDSGYDDASTDTLPLIVEYTGGRQARAAVPGTTTTAQLESIGGAGLAVDKDEAAAAWDRLEPTPQARSAGAVAGIWLDEVVHGTDLGTPTVPLTGATAAHDLGLDGEGVTVAVLDTGYDTEHVDLSDQVVRTASFVDGEEVMDLNGHGTHVASTVAGSGAASHGEYAGMAPGAGLLIGKVLGDAGSGSTSGIIDGMEWAVAEGADIVSMSLGASGASDCTGPNVTALENLSDDALFVVAAGNDSLRRTVSTPGCAPSALTVGAIDREGQTAPFSSRGPSVDGETAKPDIVSQGVAVVAAQAGGILDQAYVAKSGTSMATPHVSGGAALALQAAPDLTPRELKDVLTSSAGTTEAPVLDQGAGPMDAARAVVQTVTGPANTSLGEFAYPQSELAPAAASLTLSNAGDEDVELTLDAEVRGDDGSSVPAGLVSLDAGTVVVPADGSADVPLTVDPTVEVGIDDYGTLTGRLVGTADGVSVTVPFSLVMETPSADVTFEGLSRDGDPVDSTSTVRYVDHAAQRVGGVTLDHSGPGTTTVRLPYGRYTFAAQLLTRDEPGMVGIVESLTQDVVGDVEIDGDTTLTFDARDGEEIVFDTPQDSESRGRLMGWTYGLSSDGWVKASSLQTIPQSVKSIYATPGAVDDDFTFVATSRQYAPGTELVTGTGRVLDDLPASGGPELDGAGSADVVHIGKGTEENFAAHDVEGKVVLVDAGPGGGNYYTWSNGAVAGGAVAVLVAVPDTEGRFQVSGSYAELPISTITWTDSLALQDSAAARVSWSGTPVDSSPFSYTLAHVSHGEITAGVQKVKKSDLAQVPTQFRTLGADTQQLWTDVKVKVAGAAAAYAGGTPLQVQAPLERTDWYTGGDDVAWETSVADGRGRYVTTLFDGPRTYDAPSKEPTSWFATPASAVSSTIGTPMLSRSSNLLAPNMPHYGDAAGHDGITGTGRGWYQLLVDGEVQVPQGGTFVMPQDDSLVTLRRGFERNASAQDQLGLAFDTEFTFRSSRHTQGAQRVLEPRLVAGTDLTNGAPAGEPVEVEVWGVAGGDREPTRLNQARLQYAYGEETSPADVTQWREAQVRRHGTSWVATVPNDAPAGSFVHLRVMMHDAHGSTVDQKSVRAYVLDAG